MVGRLNHMSKSRRCGPRADELLEQFGLTDAATGRSRRTRADAPPPRPRRGPGGRPPMLFLDEPTTGLDPQSRQDLWGVIEQLVTRGTTVLLTTQYLEEADRLADRVVVDRPRPGHRRGHPAELKADLGATVIVVTLRRPRGGRRRRADPARPAGRAARPAGRGAQRRAHRGAAGPRTAAEALRTLDQHGLGVDRAGAARAQPRRRLPGPHRPPGRDRARRPRGGRRRRGPRRRATGAPRDHHRPRPLDGRPDRPGRAGVAAGCAGPSPTPARSPGGTSFATSGSPTRSSSPPSSR